MLTRLWWTQSNLNKLQIIITHQFFQKCKLLGNDEFNHLFVRILASKFNYSKVHKKNPFAINNLIKTAFSFIYFFL